MFVSRYSIRTLLVAVTLVAAYFPCAKTYHSWFVNKYAGYYNGSLVSQVQNGDSINDVSELFDSMRLLTPADEHDMRNIASVWASQKLDIEEGDQLFHFSCVSGHGVYLQFRDGRLVNFPNGAYKDARKLAEINNDPIPHALLLMGVWPYYVVCIGFASVMFALFYRRRRKRSHVDLASRGITNG
jgi:hypothetical protein